MPLGLLPGARFEFMRKLDELAPETEGGNPRISLAEVARRIGVQHPEVHQPFGARARDDL
jgi:hypothetical protein